MLWDLELTIEGCRWLTWCPRSWMWLFGLGARGWRTGLLNLGTRVYWRVFHTWTSAYADAGFNLWRLRMLALVLIWPWLWSSRALTRFLNWLCLWRSASTGVDLVLAWFVKLHLNWRNSWLCFTCWGPRVLARLLSLIEKLKSNNLQYI